MRILVLAVLVFFWGCDSGGSGTSEDKRSFYMGFTPWPYAATIEAISDVYGFINFEGDLVAHHFQQGLPYTESNILNIDGYSAANIRSEIDGRISSTDSGKVIYLAIDSLNASRNGLIDQWDGSGSNRPRTAPWDSRNFDSTEVITAYVEFSIAVIERFRNSYGRLPEYFNYGTEVSELMINSSADFTKFIFFAQNVYAALKAQYPSVKFMVSLALKDPGSSAMSTVAAGFDQIKNYVDVVGISVYPYAFFTHVEKGNPDNLPSDWISQIKTIAPGKPYAVTETGWIAENLSIPAYSLNVTSDGAAQARFAEKLFEECNELGAEFIVWFTSYDYDTLWTDTLGSDSLSKIWKDTGFISETFDERPGLATWRAWMSFARKE